MPEREAILGQHPLDLAETILALLARAGEDLPATCGGGGRCGRCVVRITQGQASPPTAIERELLGRERLEQGWRLACEARVTGPVRIAWEVPPGSGQVKTLAGTTREVPLAPAVRRKTAAIPVAGAKDLRGDWERIQAAVGTSQEPDLWSTAGLAGLDHRQSSAELLFSGDRLRGLAPAGALLGAIFDLGTTTVVGGLIDLETGELLAVRSAYNSQRIYGADVLARLGHALQGEEGRLALRDRIRLQIRAILEALLARAGVSKDNLVDLVIVGNTAMEHLFLGLSVAGLAQLPFTPVHQSGLKVPAAALDLPAHPGAHAYFAPNLAGFIGGDTAAGIIATGLRDRQGPVLLIDLGTNGELVLAHEGRLWACSTAAGPAFEGAEISCGMPGQAGAIERVDWGGGELHVGVIGGGEAQGICGSGLIDAVAVLLQTGMLDPTGRLGAGDVGAQARALREAPLRVVLAQGWREVVLTQGDIRQVQLAKGAIAAGVRLLCGRAGLQPGDLRQVLLAGAFGQHVDVEKAARLGLFPEVPPERVEAVGNVAGEGARLLLTNTDCRREAEALAGEVQVIELAAEPEFQMVFAEEMMFPS